MLCQRLFSPNVWETVFLLLALWILGDDPRFQPREQEGGCYKPDLLWRFVIVHDGFKTKALVLSLARDIVWLCCEPTKTAPQEADSLDRPPGATCGSTNLLAGSPPGVWAPLAQLFWLFSIFGTMDVADPSGLWLLGLSVWFAHGL